MAFGLVMSSNTQQKSQLTQLGIYIISNIDFYNFIHLLCEGPYSREPKDTLLNEPVTTQPSRQNRRENTCMSHLTTGGPGKEQGTNKLPPTRILERSARGQQEMGDCSPEVLATST